MGIISILRKNKMELVKNLFDEWTETP